MTTTTASTTTASISTSATSATSAASAAEYLASARLLATMIDDNAAKAEGGPVAAESVTAMRDAGLYGIAAPTEVGGAELSLVDQLDLFAEISRADGSTGWCLMASCTASSYFAAWCPESLMARMYNADAEVPLVAGQFAPAGSAERADGGWTLSGDYQFGSGINDASHVGAGAFTVPGPGENADFRLFVMPKSEVELTGNWDVMGLTGTASWDYRVDSVFVPDDATFSFFGPERHRGGPTYDLGVMPLTSLGHAAWAIGIVRRALDELVSLAQSKQRLGAPSTLADSDYVHMEIAELEARFRAAKHWVYNSFEAAETEARTAEGTPDPALSLDARMATAFVNQQGADIVRRVYLLAGSSALRAGPIQRCFRDIHAGTQHAMVSPNVTKEFGTHLLEGRV